jgi:precorrin-2 dehydrogenase/sirohydrochlorin ferrochelatase
MEDAGCRPLYYPLFCDLRGRKVLVVGGGNVARRKVETLLGSGADVHVVSPELVPGLGKLVQQERITWHERGFLPEDCDGAWLIIAATDDEAVQQEVFRQAEARQIFCNVVDRPEVCSFIVPSQVRRGDLCLAISTGGQSPALAKALRKRLEAQFPEAWGLFVELAGELRRLILAGAETPPSPETLERCAEVADLRVPEWIGQGLLSRVEEWAAGLCGPEGRDAAARVLRSMEGRDR